MVCKCLGTAGLLGEEYCPHVLAQFLDRVSPSLMEL